MFGERGYLAFPTKAFAGKPPQGFMSWCCSCFCPRRRRETPKTARRTLENDNNPQQQLSHDESCTSIGKVDDMPIIQIEHSTPVSEKRRVSTDFVEVEVISSSSKQQYASSTPDQSKKRWIDIPLFKRRRFSADESVLLHQDNVKKNPRKTRTLDSLGRRSGRDAEIPVLKIYNTDGSEYSEEGKLMYCLSCSLHNFTKNYK